MILLSSKLPEGIVNPQREAKVILLLVYNKFE